MVRVYYERKDNFLNTSIVFICENYFPLTDFFVKWFFVIFSLFGVLKGANQLEEGI